MKTILTEEIILELGFTDVSSVIQKSYQLILVDKVQDDPSDFDKGPLYLFKAVSLTVCNDKGKGEYYLFLREGHTANRIQDDVIVITRELLYKEDLEEFIRICNLKV